MSSFGLGGAPHPDAGKKRASVSSGAPDFDSQMQSLLDAPIPVNQDKKGKKKSIDLELNVNFDLLKLKRLNR